jgi:uncharacterized protein (DUF2062 family)
MSGGTLVPLITRHSSLVTFFMLRSLFRRLLSLDDPPERTALAFSIGVLIAFSPFLGLHTLMATAVAFWFRFNRSPSTRALSSTIPFSPSSPSRWRPTP